MRHQYTPMFRDVLSSRVWAASPSVRCVWMWLRLNADPEGYVVGTPLGVAIGANVTEELAREALGFFESEDPDADPEDPHGGRIIKRVPRGWLVLAYEEDMLRAKAEATKARKRRYMQRQRDEDHGHVEPQNDHELPDVDESAESCTHLNLNLNPNLRAEGESPLPPAAPLPVVDAPTRPVPLFTIPDSWEPSDELRADATIAGVRDFDARVTSLRSGPIGGQRGVLPDKLDGYVRSFFGKWKTWAQTDAAKAASGGKRGVTVAMLEPKAKHIRVAAKFGIPLAPIITKLYDQKIPETLGSDAFHEHLERAIAIEAKRIERERAA